MDISNNIGEKIIEAKNSKILPEIEKRRIELQEGLKIIKSLSPDGDLDTNKKILIKLLNLFYSGKHLQKRLSQVAFIKTNEHAITQAYNTYISREDTLEKMVPQDF